MSRAGIFGFLALACGSSLAPPHSGSGPGWAAAGDRSDDAGSTFICQGEGETEEQALTTAQGACNDKVCRLCGVEVESVIQTTETLDGVSMQRKVVERCRQFRKSALKVGHKSTDCGPAGCVAWLEVTFSKEDEKTECSAYASEHFADPDECERLIQEFRTTQGRNAASLYARQRLLDGALAACANIDVRPTPLLDALHEQLMNGMNVFEFTPEKQQARTETPFFDTTWYRSRADMMADRKATDFYLTTVGSLRQKIRETKTLVGRIQLVRQYIHNRALVFDVIEATGSPEFDSKSGIARLLAALEAAPLGVQYESADVHFYPLYSLGEARTDISTINDFYRRSYPPESLHWPEGIPLASMFSKDQRVDAADWDYLFALHREHTCPVCLIKLLEVPDHGRPELRDQRFFAAVELELSRTKDIEQQRRRVAELITSDAEFAMHIRPRLSAALQAGLDWDFFLRRVREAEDDDELGLVQKLVPLLVGTLAIAPGVEVSHNYCIGLADKLAVITKLGGPLASLREPICACLGGPLAKEGTRSLVNKSDLYDYALVEALPCVSPSP